MSPLTIITHVHLIDNILTPRLLTCDQALDARLSIEMEVQMIKAFYHTQVTTKIHMYEVSQTGLEKTILSMMSSLSKREKIL